MRLFASRRIQLNSRQPSCKQADMEINNSHSALLSSGRPLPGAAAKQRLLSRSPIARHAGPARQEVDLLSGRLHLRSQLHRKLSPQRPETRPTPAADLSAEMPISCSFVLFICMPKSANNRTIIDKTSAQSLCVIDYQADAYFSSPLLPPALKPPLSERSAATNLSNRPTPKVSLASISQLAAHAAS